MKQNIVIVLLFLVTTFGAKAQTFKEKLKAKVEAAKEKAKALDNKPTNESISLDPNISQSVIASSWDDGEYDYYIVPVGTDVSSHREPEAEKAKISLVKNESNEVTSVEFNGQKYIADQEGKSNFVRYYRSIESDYKRLCFLGRDKLIYVKVTTRSNQYTTLAFIGAGGGNGKYQDEANAKEYIEASKVNQEADLKAYNENKALAQANALAERKAKFSLENKQVDFIKIIDVKRDVDYRNPSKKCSFGHYRGFSFAIEATLKNGTKIKTNEEGFMSDYDVTFGNVKLSEANKVKGEFIESDKIIISAKSIHHPSISTSSDLIMEYDEDLYFDWDARKWGYSAHNYKIEIKQVKHKVTNVDLLQVRITDVSSGTKIGDFKIKQDRTIHFSCSGQPGYDNKYSASDGSHGGNGGNGGTITLIKDPSVKFYNLDFKNNGGTGGNSAYGYPKGRDGRDGLFQVEVRTVNF